MCQNSASCLLRLARTKAEVVEETGAGARNRTADLRITNALLYRLSYASSERQEEWYIMPGQRIATRIIRRQTYYRAITNLRVVDAPPALIR